MDIPKDNFFTSKATLISEVYGQAVKINQKTAIKKGFFKTTFLHPPPKSALLMYGYCMDIFTYKNPFNFTHFVNTWSFEIDSSFLKNDTYLNFVRDSQAL